MPVKMSERQLLYVERKKDGCCPRCGKKRKKTDKFIFCSDCLEFFRNYNSKHSGEMNRKRKARYDLRKEKNQCPRCGKRLGMTYKNTICTECLEKQYKYNYKKTRSRKTRSSRPKNQKQQ